MKKTVFVTILLVMFALTSNAQYKKDGTPDMRYKANKQMYGNTYSTPNYKTSSYSTPSYPKSTNKSSNSISTPKTNTRNYSNGGQYRIQNGYYKSNGTYVAPHVKTTPDNYKWNNLNYKW